MINKSTISNLFKRILKSKSNHSNSLDHSHNNKQQLYLEVRHNLIYKATNLNLLDYLSLKVNFNHKNLAKHLKQLHPYLGTSTHLVLNLLLLDNNNNNKQSAQAPYLDNLLLNLQFNLKPNRSSLVAAAELLNHFLDKIQQASKH